MSILLNQSIMCYAKSAENFPFVMFLPQCSANTWFDVFEQLRAFVKTIAALPYVDTKNVYLSGVSMGGYASWQMLMSEPNIFRLHKYVDIAIDCKVPYGDACMEVGDTKMGGLSTYAACFILNTCLINGAKLALQESVQLPVYISGNVEGGREHNITLENLFMGRVKHL